ncbi:MAG TPA: glutamyl-tRNA reductase [Tepidisphaeraceae bacterium]|jgi:glutamyl-tRNA reductase|nr:glutamyl-tRNA reductase [Tepidisphaeraceae bacterium]
MNRLLLVGLNHTTAPLEVREALVFDEQQAGDALRKLRERFPEAEAVLLSTCNRVEMYVSRSVHGHPREEEMIEFLADFHGLSTANVASHFYRKADKAAAGHLFAVASSLDSMVLGETQIVGQVRAAYDIALQAAAAGPTLNPLFQRALAIAKRVMSETPLAEGRMSVASVAVDYARRIFDHFNDKTLLCIGAGKMGTLVLQGFATLGPGKLVLANRDPARAEALANQFHGQASGLEKLDEHLIAADIVISSTGSAHPIITRERFEHLVKQRRYRPIFIIDIAMPRDVEATVGQIQNVYLYNIDDLQQVVSDTQAQRAGAVEAAKKIVDEQLEDFLAWHRTRELGPLIDQLYKRYHQVAQDEVSRTINKLGQISEQERQHLEELARRIVNKLLHDPIQTLKQSDSLHGQVGQYLHAMERLFKLADPPEEQSRRQEEQQ